MEESAAAERIFGDINTDLAAQSIYSGVDEKKRIKDIRSNIASVRNHWNDKNLALELRAKVRKFIAREDHSAQLRQQIDNLLESFHDWIDMDRARGTETPLEKYTAIELYCSREGFDLLFKLFNDLMKTEDVTNEKMLVGAALVEFLTIELYNLRLANIGDPRYANFQGKVYRGMSVSPEAVENYRKTARHAILTERSFSIPLGFTSCTTDKKTMVDFAKTQPGHHQMHWTVHVHGIDPSLLARYQSRYPDSVVTSICAMPVGRVADLAEKEVLLRGAFFHIVKMTSKVSDGIVIHRLILVMINSNRDHGTEHASDEAEKAEQRRFFLDTVQASKFEICANLARKHALIEDAEGYEELAKKALARIDAVDHVKSAYNPALADSWSGSMPTWIGAANPQAYPKSYVRQRERLHDAARDGKWQDVLKVINREYESRKVDWFNVQCFSDGLTVMHQMALHGPPHDDDPSQEAWRNLIAEIERLEPWLSQKSRVERQTATHMARSRGFEELAEELVPRQRTPISKDHIHNLERQLHNLIAEKVGNRIDSFQFALPQLSILSEMHHPKLWVPIPHIYTGFFVALTRDNNLEVTVFETIPGQTQQRQTPVLLK